MRQRKQEEGTSGAAGFDGTDDAMFLRARDRGFVGFDQEVEGAWRGSFNFVQWADPQLGMLHEDAS